jgi:hypothetical protein
MLVAAAGMMSIGLAAATLVAETYPRQHRGTNVRLYREGLAALLRKCPSIELLGAISVSIKSVRSVSAPAIVAQSLIGRLIR